MAKIKSPTPKLRLAHWAVILLTLVIIPVAIYAMTTWNDSPGDNNSNPSTKSPSSLKVNNNASPTSDVNNNPMPAQSATSMAGGQNTQPSAPSSPGTDYNYPTNPVPCPPDNLERVCAQY